jgi:hypothetical protein
MISGPVAFDSSEITAWKVRMYNAKIDPEERHALMWVNFPPSLLERAHDGIFQRAIPSRDPSARRPPR